MIRSGWLERLAEGHDRRPRRHIAQHDGAEAVIACPPATARLLDGIGGTVFTLGDHAYFQGTAQEFRDCYDPTWGPSGSGWHR